MISHLAAFTILSLITTVAFSLELYLMDHDNETADHKVEILIIVTYLFIAAGTLVTITILIMFVRHSHSLTLSQ